MQDLKIVVKEIKGVCRNVKVGDYFIARARGTISIPEGHFCYWALNSILPLLPAKQRKLEPDDWLSKTWLVECPDPNGRVIMEMVPIDSK